MVILINAKEVLDRISNIFQKKMKISELINNIHRKSINLHCLDLGKAFLNVALKEHIAKNRGDKTKVT